MASSIIVGLNVSPYDIQKQCQASAKEPSLRIERFTIKTLIPDLLFFQARHYFPLIRTPLLVANTPTFTSHELAQAKLMLTPHFMLVHTHRQDFIVYKLPTNVCCLFPIHYPDLDGLINFRYAHYKTAYFDTTDYTFGFNLSTFSRRNKTKNKIFFDGNKIKHLNSFARYLKTDSCLFQVPLDLIPNYATNGLYLDTTSKHFTYSHQSPYPRKRYSKIENCESLSVDEGQVFILPKDDGTDVLFLCNDSGKTHSIDAQNVLRMKDNVRIGKTLWKFSSICKIQEKLHEMETVAQERIASVNEFITPYDIANYWFSRSASVIHPSPTSRNIPPFNLTSV